jgi:pyruvate formate lyase activating enzyme
MNDGGVTFSGGEPLAQAPFLREVIDRLMGMHVILDTSGFAAEEDFTSVVGKCSLVYFDLKIMDPSTHRYCTGVDNARILHNLSILPSLQVPYVIRVPLVPGLTDTYENLESIAGLVRNLAGLMRVDLLPYNRAAGGKYASLGKQFTTLFDENLPVNTTKVPFQKAGVPVQVAGNHGKSPCL